MEPVLIYYPNLPKRSSMKSFLYFSEETTHFKQKLISYTAPSPPKEIVIV